MASLSNSTDVYVDKLYIDFGEVGVVDLAETVAAKAEKSKNIQHFSYGHDSKRKGRRC